MSCLNPRGETDLWSKVVDSKPFRERIGMYKYAHWAQGLTQEQFMGLLCAVGEYGCRGGKVLQLLRRYAPADDRSFARAMMALEVLAEFAAGRPSTEGQMRERVFKTGLAAQNRMFRNNILARRPKLQDLRILREHYGEAGLFDVLFSTFTQDPPLPRSAQAMMGTYLRKLKPRGTQEVGSLVRASLRGWDVRVAQLPQYFREAYGMEFLRPVLDRLGGDASLSAPERKALRGYNRWLRSRPGAEPAAE